MKIASKVLSMVLVLSVLNPANIAYITGGNGAGNTVHANTASDIEESPTDTKRLYSVVIDRFLDGSEGNNEGVTEDATEPTPYGGDFAGIESELEYISGMGFDTLHLSPVVEHQTEDYLGYNVTDYSQIAESFGGAEAFESLIDAAHDHNLEVIVDMPMTATDEFTVLDSPEVNDIYADYLSSEDLSLIDFTEQPNQEAYADILQNFSDEFDIDGYSFMVGQSDIDASTFVPEDMTSYAITTSPDMDTDNFDYTATEESREALAESFATVDRDIPELPQSSDELLLADTWFSERFTNHAVDENMFPGTRVKQLVTYLYSHAGPMSMLYGTEVALNGDDIPSIHRQMDLRTDQEVVDYISEINSIYSEHKSDFTGDLETIINEDGHYVTRFMTDDVDYFLNVNDTSKTDGVTLSLGEENADKALSGMLIGDMVRANDDGEHIIVLDREETELYALIEDAGFNNGYIIASVIIFGGFAIFVFFAARNSKKKKNKTQA